MYLYLFLFGFYRLLLFSLLLPFTLHLSISISMCNFLYIKHLTVIIYTCVHTCTHAHSHTHTHTQGAQQYIMLILVKQMGNFTKLHHSLNNFRHSLNRYLTSPEFYHANLCFKTELTDLKTRGQQHITQAFQKVILPKYMAQST